MEPATFPTLIHYQIALTVLLVVVGINLIANFRMLGKAAPHGEGPRTFWPVSILVPARNEARNIRRCLESLLAQDYPLLEVVVLDDGSTDETPEIVAEMAREHPRLRVVRGQPLPPGWMGKNFACDQLARIAQGEWLLFTDADTVHRPDTVSWAIEAAQQNQADLVSLIPHTVTHSFGEEILLPIIPFGVVGCFPLALGERLRIPLLTMAVGPFMLFRREAYQRIGGHRAVRGEIAEDVVLARRMRRFGGRVVLLDGSEQVDVHFYHGFLETWRGLAKSAFAALEYRILPTALMLLFYGFLFLWPVLLLFEGLWQGRMGEPTVRLALFQVFLNTGLWYAVAVRFRLPRRTAFLYPLTVLLVILVMLDSVRQAAFGEIAWKERAYRVRGGSVR
ncbi:MAG TPA: glycosyltransferase [Thermoflexia bacterium]|jgi:chlorobactene glucosyltransferase|nr:glycosyltransferase [Thermoflexia bacterium]